MKKGAAALILGLAPRKGGAAKDESSSENAGEESDTDGLEVAASDLMAAIKSGDTQGVASALRAAHDMCSCMGEED